MGERQHRGEKRRIKVEANAGRVREAILRWLDGERARTVVVGVSGGLDSMVLAHALHGCALARGLNLHIAHFDHALRAESAEDARFVEAWAIERNLPFHCARWEQNGRFRNGLEAAARTARYRYLAEVARAVAHPADNPARFPVVVVAHHEDDQAETVLLNLARGAGRGGLVGMQAECPLPEQGAGRRVRLVRPFLGLPRRALRDYAAIHGVAWREDLTNAFPNRPRAAIRHKVLPELERILPGATSHIARSADADASIRAQVERLRALMLVACMPEHDAEQRAVFSVAALRTLGLTDRAGVIGQGLREVFPAHFDGDHMALARLAEFVDRPPRAGGPWPLVGDLVYSVVGAPCGEVPRLVVHLAQRLPLQPDHPWLDEAFRREISRHVVAGPDTFCRAGWCLRVEEAAIPTHLAGDPWQAWIDAGCTSGLALTTPQRGMRFSPLGMLGRTRALGDFFTDRKIPAALRVGWPLIVDAASGSVLWVCGLALSHVAAIGPQTARALHLAWARV